MVKESKETEAGGGEGAARGDERAALPDAVTAAPTYPEPEGSRPGVTAGQRRHGAEVVGASHDVQRTHGDPPRYRRD